LPELILLSVVFGHPRVFIFILNLRRDLTRFSGSSVSGVAPLFLLLCASFEVFDVAGTNSRALTIDIIFVSIMSAWVLGTFEDLVDLMGEYQVQCSQNDLLRIVQDPFVEGFGREATHSIAKHLRDRILHCFFNLDEPLLNSINHRDWFFEKEKFLILADESKDFQRF